MFKEMRRKDRMLSNEEAKDILKNCEYGVLSSISDNGYPYSVPLSYVYFDDAIYFHSAREGHKIENIKINEKVSFSAVRNTEILPGEFSTNYESVIIFGTASEALDDEKYSALMELINKYDPDSNKTDKGKKYISALTKQTYVVKITVEHITGKSRR